MRTAVDSSVLLDVFSAGAAYGERSRTALRAAYDTGSLIACEIVWAEIRVHFTDDAAFDAAMSKFGVEFSALSPQAARLAGSLWRRQRSTSAATKSRVVADFVIGAHAITSADVLLTRDRGFYRKWFSGLRINDPSAR